MYVCLGVYVGWPIVNTNSVGLHTVCYICHQNSVYFLLLLQSRMFPLKFQRSGGPVIAYRHRRSYGGPMIWPRPSRTVCSNSDSNRPGFSTWKFSYDNVKFSIRTEPAWKLITRRLILGELCLVMSCASTVRYIGWDEEVLEALLIKNKHSPYKNNRYQHVFVLSFSDERDAIQKKTFTKWVNKHLKKVKIFFICLVWVMTQNRLRQLCHNLLLNFVL